MKPETLLHVLGLGLRAAEAAVRRRGPQAAPPSTRVDRLVQRVLPMAEKALDRAAPRRRRARRRSALAQAAATAFGALAAGSLAYVVVKEQQRVRARYRPLRAPFPENMLDVLAAPGGGGRLSLSQAGRSLLDAQSGAEYALIDGIPDFIAPVAWPAEQLASDDSWVQDLIRPIALELLGRNHTGNAAYAGAVAAGVGSGWVLSVPAGRGTYEVEMARINPHARILCLSNNWDVLLEIRRRGLEAGLGNLYFARGIPRLLPLKDKVMSGVWTGGGLHRYPAPERELTQMIRVARPGALIAGVSLVYGGPRLQEALLRLGARYAPGLRSRDAHLALLQAVGLRDVRLARDGGFLRFSAVLA
jgi:SAM-dependent methyltransferase